MPLVIYDPTDTLNDASALQAAINQAGPGGRVELAQGRCRLNATVRITTPLTLAGMGPGTTLVRAPGFAGNLLDVRTSRGTIVRDFAVDDACSPELKKAEVAVHAVSLWNCQDAVIENVQIRNGFRGGINVSECNGVTVNQCVIEDCGATPMPPAGQAKGGHGINVYARAGQICRNVTVTHCTLRRNWRTGILIGGSSEVLVEGCDFQDNMPQAAMDAGIEVGGQVGVWTGCKGIVIANNKIVGGIGTQGVEVDVTNIATDPETNRVIVIGNTIKNQGRTGLLLWMDPNTPAAKRSARVAIIGNMLDNNSVQNNNWYGGMTIVTGVCDFVISGNVVREEGQAAVKIHGDNQRWLMVGNHLETTGPAAFIDGNQSASGTTGVIGAGVYVSHGAES